MTVARARGAGAGGLEFMRPRSMGGGCAEIVPAPVSPNAAFAAVDYPNVIACTASAVSTILAVGLGLAEVRNT